MASVAPAVTRTSVSGSWRSPYQRGWCSTIAWRSSGTPRPGGYWLRPPRMASTAASSTSGGPSVSGNPWPRLMAPVATASADISAKIVVPNPWRRLVRYGTRSAMTRPSVEAARSPRVSDRGRAGAGRRAELVAPYPDDHVIRRADRGRRRAAPALRRSPSRGEGQGHRPHRRRCPCVPGPVTVRRAGHVGPQRRRRLAAGRTARVRGRDRRPAAGAGRPGGEPAARQLRERAGQPAGGADLPDPGDEREPADQRAGVPDHRSRRSWTPAPTTARSPRWRWASRSTRSTSTAPRPSAGRACGIRRRGPTRRTAPGPPTSGRGTSTSTSPADAIDADLEAGYAVTMWQAGGEDAPARSPG